MIDLTHPEIGLAVKMVEQASHLAKQIQKEMVVPALAKEDSSPVTVADFAIQALVARSLAEAYPEVPLVAEESSDSFGTQEGQTILEQVIQWVGRIVPGATGEEVCRWIDHGAQQPGRRFWTLDPIDGTKGFVRKDQYAVALALVVEGKVQIGVLGCPNLDGGSLVVAVRDQGCWKARLLDEARNFQQLQVSEQDDPSQARVLRSFESGHTHVSQMDELMTSLGVQAEPVRMDSQAKYALLAEGKGDLLFRLLSPRQPDYRERIWDQAAGTLVVEEAGGNVTDLDGKPLDFSVGKMLVANRGVLASNGRLHQAALEVLGASKMNPESRIQNEE
jgi:3'(2'), 5'-bisphosphate nucleotidase